MAEPLSKDTFETFVGEHQKYLDSKFDKLAGCIDGVRTSIDEINDSRKEDWKEHAEDCEACKACHDKKFKTLHKYILVGCIGAALLGGVLAPVIGIDVIAAFVKALLTLGPAAAGL